MFKIYKIKFESPVRFHSSDYYGDLNSADFVASAATLFSALYYTALELKNEKLQNYLLSEECYISDLLPYVYEDLYIPKPIIKYDFKKELDKKKMKKTRFIPLNMLKDYFENPQEIIDENIVFGEFNENIKAAIIRDGEPRPYKVKSFTFEDGCGLYFVIKIKEELLADFNLLLTVLGKTGIGGKKSSGYGKFSVLTIEESEELNELLKKESNNYLTLSSFIPKEEEFSIITEGTYKMHLKSGFVYSEIYTDTAVKKDYKLIIDSGSCFPKRMKGQIYVENKGNHPIYTYGKPLMIGVDVDD